MNSSKSIEREDAVLKSVSLSIATLVFWWSRMGRRCNQEDLKDLIQDLCLFATNKYGKEFEEAPSISEDQLDQFVKIMRGVARNLVRRQVKRDMDRRRLNPVAAQRILDDLNSRATREPPTDRSDVRRFMEDRLSEDEQNTARLWYEHGRSWAVVSENNVKSKGANKTGWSRTLAREREHAQKP